MSPSDKDHITESPSRASANAPLMESSTIKDWLSLPLDAACCSQRWAQRKAPPTRC